MTATQQDKPTAPPAARLARICTDKFGVVLVGLLPHSKETNIPRWNVPGAGIRDGGAAEKYWTQHPDYGIGILHSESHTAALDIDHSEAERVLASVGVNLKAVTEKASLVVQGDPTHPAKPFYRLPTGVTLKPRKFVFPNPEPGPKARPVTIFELRAGPVQDVIHAIHPDTGEPYILVKCPKPGETLAELPAELLNLWQNWDELLPAMQALCPWTQPAPSVPSVPSVPRTPGADGAAWDQVRDDVLRRYPLADGLAEVGVTLKGGKGLCPFHAEKEPSFWTYKTPDGTGRWCCAHGGAPVGVATASGYSDGDAIDLYAHAHGLTPGKALSELAASLGIENPGSSRTPAEGGHHLSTPSDGRDTERPAPPWPTPLRGAAYHGVVGEFTRLVEPHTESDPAALLLQTLVMFGSLAGRSAYFEHESTKHHTNLFLAVVGQSSRSRKGTSGDHVHRIAGMADSVWAATRVADGLSSGEGLIWAVRDPTYKKETVKEKGGKSTGATQEVLVDAGVDDKRLLIHESEFGGAFRVMQRDGNTLSPIVRKAYDKGDLRSLTKNSPAQATGAHISIIANITATELRGLLAESDTYNGFANRFLWCCVKRSKLLPNGGTVPDSDLVPIADVLRSAAEASRRHGHVERSPEANELWRTIYPDLSSDVPGVLGAVTSRAEAQVLRVSMIYALLDCSSVIEVEHLLAALEVWRFCNESAAHIFGNATGNRTADRILAALSATPDGLTRSAVSGLFDGHKNARVLDEALELLAAGGLAVAEQKATGGTGRPATTWWAV
jgi:hypothetical protein